MFQDRAEAMDFEVSGARPGAKVINCNGKSKVWDISRLEVLAADFYISRSLKELF